MRSVDKVKPPTEKDIMRFECFNLIAALHATCGTDVTNGNVRLTHSSQLWGNSMPGQGASWQCCACKSPPALTPSRNKKKGCIGVGRSLILSRNLAFALSNENRCTADNRCCIGSAAWIRRERRVWQKTRDNKFISVNDLRTRASGLFLSLLNRIHIVLNLQSCISCYTWKNNRRDGSSGQGRRREHYLYCSTVPTGNVRE